MKLRVPPAISALLVAGLAGCPPTVTVAPPLAQTSEYGPPTIDEPGLKAPSGIAVDRANGRVLIADTASRRLRHAPIQQLVIGATWSDSGFVSDANAVDALSEPQAVAVGAGGVFVVDSARGLVRRFVLQGGDYVLDAAFFGNSPITAAGQAVRLPRDLAISSDGRIFLLDSGTARILVASGPSATTWSVLRREPSWSNPYGLALGQDGSIFVADTGNHRIVKLAADGTPIASFGTYGSADGLFNGPRGIVELHDGRLAIADTENHRVVTLRADGSFHSRVAGAPGMLSPQRVAVDAQDHIFIIDSVAQWLTAFLGAAAGRAFDLYVRDYIGDTGIEPSNGDTRKSPDLLVRKHPDVDVAHPPAGGLESISFEPLQTGQDAFVYVAVHNHGRQPSPPAAVRLYWGDPNSKLEFPADWKGAGFYSPDGQTTTNSLALPPVPASSAGADGLQVGGPLLFRPPMLRSAFNQTGTLDLFARVIEVDDPTPVMTPSGLPEVPRSNNVCWRVEAVACLPQCSGKVCGDDQCAGSCGACASPATCTAAGQCVCIPACNGKTCGPDGCGGVCGSCAADQTCAAGICRTDPCAACTDDQVCVARRCVEKDCGGGCPDGYSCGPSGKCHRCTGLHCN
ncbi:MAG: NHL repeat-containing protein [Deltaproteobacteria bacterium]|nr:NHL repeat-containing protein [Deltaproteobacteria bacterium]